MTPLDHCSTKLWAQTNTSRALQDHTPYKKQSEATLSDSTHCLVAAQRRRGGGI